MTNKFGINVLGPKSQAHFLKYLDESYIELITEVGSIDKFFNDLPYSAQYGLIQEWFDSIGFHISTSIHKSHPGIVEKYQYFKTMIVIINENYTVNFSLNTTYDTRIEALVIGLIEISNLYEKTNK